MSGATASHESSLHEGCRLAIVSRSICPTARSTSTSSSRAPRRGSSSFRSTSSTRSVKPVTSCVTRPRVRSCSRDCHRRPRRCRCGPLTTSRRPQRCTALTRYPTRPTTICPLASSTRRAQRDPRKARCSRTTTWPRTPPTSFRAGRSRIRIARCSRCRCSTYMASATASTHGLSLDADSDCCRGSITRLRRLNSSISCPRCFLVYRRCSFACWRLMKRRHVESGARRDCSSLDLLRLRPRCFRSSSGVLDTASSSGTG